MLKKTSLALTLLLLSVGFAIGQNITTITEKFEGNIVSILVRIDTIQTWGAMTGADVFELEKHEKIEKLNGHNIYYNNWASEPVGSASQSDIRSFIILLVNEDLKSSKGVRTIDVVIDEEGKLAFIRFQYIDGVNDSEEERESMRKNIIAKLKEIKFIPAKHKGKAVPYGFDIMPGSNITTITEKFEENTVSIRVQKDSFKNGCIAMGNEKEYTFERRETIQSLNGMDIFYDKQANKPVSAAAQKGFYNYIRDLVKKETNSTEEVFNNNVSIDVILDEKGDLGFIRFEFDYDFAYDEEDPEKEKENFRQTVIKKLKTEHFAPAMHNGKAVPYGTRISVKKDF